MIFPPQRWGVFFAVTLSLVLGMHTARAQHYTIDDGTSELPLSWGNGSSNSGSIWLNSFTVDPRFDVINSIAVAWSAPLGINNTSGVGMQALLYSDPNGDGDPLDAVLLTSVAGTMQSAGTNTFITYALPPTAIITAGFFVGVYVPGFERGRLTQDIMSYDTTPPTFPNRSFVFVNFDGSEPNPIDLSSNTIAGPIESFGLAGNFLIRANATSAVPENGSGIWLLVLSSATIFLMINRRGACAAISHLRSETLRSTSR